MNKETEAVLTREDYVALAKKYQAEKGLSRREALVEVKRRHPDARELFKSGRLPD